jgi:hypothetical protein
VAHLQCGAQQKGPVLLGTGAGCIVFSASVHARIVMLTDMTASRAHSPELICTVVSAMLTTLLSYYPLVATNHVCC